jgi:hypothetical protein
MSDYSRAKRKAKAQFWQTVAGNSLLDPCSMSVAAISRAAGSDSVGGWMPDPEFAAWFLNKDYAKMSIGALTEVAVEKLEDILSDPDQKASHILAAAKMVFENTGFAPAKSTIVKYRDADIEKMSESELDKFIADRNLKSVP